MHAGRDFDSRYGGQNPNSQPKGWGRGRGWPGGSDHESRYGSQNQTSDPQGQGRGRGLPGGWDQESRYGSLNQITDPKGQGRGRGWPGGWQDKSRYGSQNQISEPKGQSRGRGWPGDWDHETEFRYSDQNLISEAKGQGRGRGKHGGKTPDSSWHGGQNPGSESRGRGKNRNSDRTQDSGYSGQNPSSKARGQGRGKHGGKTQDSGYGGQNPSSEARGQGRGKHGGRTQDSGYGGQNPSSACSEPRGQGRGRGKPSMEKGPARIVKRLLDQGEKVLIMMRGCPGSGKTFLARKLQFDGVILSTDDFFTQSGRYMFVQDQIGTAHDWNQKRALKNMQQGVNPIIIDNTNTEKWEMKPYVVEGRRHDYKVRIFEPRTEWEFDSSELAKRNSHQVPKQRIQKMIRRYDHNVTVDQIVHSSDEDRRRATARRPR